MRQARHDEVGVRIEEFLLNERTLFRSQIIVHAVVRHRGMHQEDALVEGLPEDAPRVARQAQWMEIELRVEINVSKEYVLDLLRVLFFSAELPGNAQIVHIVVIELMHLVTVSAAAVLGRGETDFAGDGRLGFLHQHVQRCVEDGEFPPVGADLPGAVGGEQEAGVRRLDCLRAGAEGERQKYGQSSHNPRFDNILPLSRKVFPLTESFSQGASSRRME